MIGAVQAKINIKKAIERMKTFNRIRVAYFEEQLLQLRTEQPRASSKIDRGPNPHLRHTGGVQLELIINNATE